MKRSPEMAFAGAQATSMATHMLNITPLQMLTRIVTHTNLNQADVARQLKVSASVLTTLRRGTEPRYSTGKGLERIYLEHWTDIRIGMEEEAKRNSQ